eukprot:7764937-Pyramimonas_sp.AAC.1
MKGRRVGCKTHTHTYTRTNCKRIVPRLCCPTSIRQFDARWDLTGLRTSQGSTRAAFLRFVVFAVPRCVSVSYTHLRAHETGAYL